MTQRKTKGLETTNHPQTENQSIVPTENAITS